MIEKVYKNLLYVNIILLAILLLSGDSVSVVLGTQGDAAIDIRYWLFMLIAGVIGLLLGVIWVLIVDYLNKDEGLKLRYERGNRKKKIIVGVIGVLIGLLNVIVIEQQITYSFFLSLEYLFMNLVNMVLLPTLLMLVISKVLNILKPKKIERVKDIYKIIFVMLLVIGVTMPYIANGVPIGMYVGVYIIPVLVSSYLILKEGVHYGIECIVLLSLVTIITGVIVG